MIYQLCHIVLGLQPLNRQAEGEIVRGWLDREEKAPLAGKYQYIFDDFSKKNIFHQKLISIS